MWFVTDRYFDDSASANVIGVGGVSDTDGYFIQPVETEPKTVDIKKSSTVELVEPKTVELKRSTVKSSR